MGDENKMNEEFWREAERKHKRGKIFGGLLIVIIGSVFLARELGILIPEWIFTWKTLLIGLGLLAILKSNFRSFGGFLSVLIGSAFLISDLYPTMVIKPLLWPIVVIIFGLIIMFKPHRKRDFYRARMRKFNRFNRFNNHNHCHTEFTQTTDEDRIESTTVMGGIKKNILSKNFKGGEVINVLGGTEINLSQADFEGSPVLEITNILGGTILIIPAHWEIHSSEVVSIMGSIEDKRPIRNDITTDKSKILVLKGTVIMGGIDIKSYK